MFEFVGICNYDPETSVWAHSNEYKHGKGKGLKAHDCFGAIACYACHTEYDNGTTMTREQKQIAFENAKDATILWLWQNEIIGVLR